MITLFAIGYALYIFIGFKFLLKMLDRYIWKDWCDLAVFLGGMLWMALPFLIALDICYGG